MNTQTNIHRLSPDNLETLPSVPLQKLLSHLEKFNEVERVYTTKTDAEFDILNIELKKSTIKNSSYIRELLINKNFCAAILRDYPLLSIKNLEIKERVFVDLGKSFSDNYMQPLHHDFLSIEYRYQPIQTFYNSPVGKDFTERQAPTLFALHKNYDPIAVAYAHKFIDSVTSATDHTNLPTPVGELFRSLRRAKRGDVPTVPYTNVIGFSKDGAPLTILDSPTTDQNLSLMLQEVLFRLYRNNHIQKIINEIYDLSKSFVYEHKWGRDPEALFFNNNLLVHCKGAGEAQLNEQPLHIFVDFFKSLSNFIFL